MQLATVETCFGIIPQEAIGQEPMIALFYELLEEVIALSKSLHV